MVTFMQMIIMITLALALVAFGHMAVTLRRPLARACAWLAFAFYFGVSAITLHVLVL